MSIADMIPALDDAALASLKANATRFEAGRAGPKQKEAALLLPLIATELAVRAAAKPKPVRVIRKKAVAAD